MNELKLCPFCGDSLNWFGRDTRGGHIVDVFKHPDLDDSWDRCPLSGLVFDKERWNTRLIEDALRSENQRLNELVGDYKEAINEVLPVTFAEDFPGGMKNVFIDGGFARLFFRSVIDIFNESGAKNYLEIRMSGTEKDVNKYLITMQNLEGKTPDELKREAESENQRLIEDAKRLAKSSTFRDENRHYYSCCVCRYCGGDDHNTRDGEVAHSPDCPITLHNALMKKLEVSE